MFGYYPKANELLTVNILELLTMSELLTWTYS